MKREPYFIDIWKTDPFTGAYVYNDAKSRVKRLEELMASEKYTPLEKASLKWKCKAMIII